VPCKRCSGGPPLISNVRGRKHLHATSLAVLGDLAVAGLVWLLILYIRRRPWRRWVLCLTALGSALILWMVMFALLALAYPYLSGIEEGHAFSNFLGPYLALGVAIILFAPLAVILWPRPLTARSRADAP